MSRVTRALKIRVSVEQCAQTSFLVAKCIAIGSKCIATSNKNDPILYYSSYFATSSN